MKQLREIFIKYLTEDNETNQAIFDEDEGWEVFCTTDLDMVMKKFDMAIREYEEENRRR